MVWPFGESAADKERRELNALREKILQEKADALERDRVEIRKLADRAIEQALEREREAAKLREETNSAQMAMQMHMMRMQMERQQARGPAESSVRAEADEADTDDQTDAAELAERIEQLESALMRIRSLAIGEEPRRLENIARIADAALQALSVDESDGDDSDDDAGAGEAA